MHRPCDQLDVARALKERQERTWSQRSNRILEANPRIAHVIVVPLRIVDIDRQFMASASVPRSDAKLQDGQSVVVVGPCEIDLGVEPLLLRTKVEAFSRGAWAAM